MHANITWIKDLQSEMENLREQSTCTVTKLVFTRMASKTATALSRHCHSRFYMWSLCAPLSNSPIHQCLLNNSAVNCPKEKISKKSLGMQSRDIIMSDMFPIFALQITCRASMQHRMRYWPEWAQKRCRKNRAVFFMLTIAVHFFRSGSNKLFLVNRRAKYKCCV